MDNHPRGAEASGRELIEVDLSAFIEADGMLYEGPWLAERLTATGAFLMDHPDDVHPVVCSLLERGHAIPGVDVFRGISRLRRLERDVADVLDSVDAMFAPTVARTFTVEQMVADPIDFNTQLGRSTTFGNLLDLAVISLPAPSHDMIAPSACRWSFGPVLTAGCPQSPQLSTRRLQPTSSAGPRTDASLVQACSRTSASGVSFPSPSERG